MYFLSAVVSGMRRRFFASLLMVLAGSSLLTAAMALGLWAQWLNDQKTHVKAVRSASVFIDSSDQSVVEEVLTKVMQIKGVESARIVAAEEFVGFLKQHFPDLHDALIGLGDDVIPRMLEVVFPADLNTFARSETVETLSVIPNVTRVDDGAQRLGKALNSLRWLSYGGAALAVALWVVLFIVCLGHYQNILYTDAQEIQLVRSFGATKFEILLPWLMEGFFQSLLTGGVCALVLLLGRGYMADWYNQFFGTVGYEPFRLGAHGFLMAAVGMAGMALLAHGIAGSLALLRGRIA